MAWALMQYLLYFEAINLPVFGTWTRARPGARGWWLAGDTTRLFFGKSLDQE